MFPKKVMVVISPAISGSTETTFLAPQPENAKAAARHIAVRLIHLLFICVCVLLLMSGALWAWRHKALPWPPAAPRPVLPPAHGTGCAVLFPCSLERLASPPRGGPNEAALTCASAYNIFLGAAAVLISFSAVLCSHAFRILICEKPEPALKKAASCFLASPKHSVHIIHRQFYHACFQNANFACGPRGLALARRTMYPHVFYQVRGLK